MHASNKGRQQELKLNDAKNLEGKKQKNEKIKLGEIRCGGKAVMCEWEVDCMGEGKIKINM